MLPQASLFTIPPTSPDRHPIRGWLPRIVVIFRSLPMDRYVGLLTIERLELPAKGVSKDARDLALGGCARETFFGRAMAHCLDFNVSADLGTGVSARPLSIDLQRGLDEMSRVCSTSTRHPDTTSNRHRVALRTSSPRMPTGLSQSSGGRARRGELEQKPPRIEHRSAVARPN